MLTNLRIKQYIKNFIKITNFHVKVKNNNNKFWCRYFSMYSSQMLYFPLNIMFTYNFQKLNKWG